MRKESVNEYYGRIRDETGEEIPCDETRYKTCNNQIMCDCGAWITKSNMATHKKRSRHFKNIEEIERRRALFTRFMYDDNMDDKKIKEIIYDK